MYQPRTTELSCCVKGSYRYQPAARKVSVVSKVGRMDVSVLIALLHDPGRDLRPGGETQFDQDALHVPLRGAG